MKILFVTSNRLGDAVISTAALAYVVETHKDAEVTVACGPIAASIFKNVPGLKRIISLKKQKRSGHWVDFWKQTVGEVWDIVIDLRDSAATRLLLRKKSFHSSSRKDFIPKVQELARILKVESLPYPHLWLSDVEKEKAHELLGDKTPILAIGPTANWAGKQWPIENFIDLEKRLTSEQGVLPGAKVAVFAAPDEREQAIPLLEAIASDRLIDLVGKTDPITAGACLSKCDCYVGNDSGLMHLAAAAGIRTMGVFGPSRDAVYAPAGAQAMWVRTDESYDELVGFPEMDWKCTHSLMTGLTVDKVHSRIKDLFEAYPK